MGAAAGFTLFELIIVIILIAALATILLGRFLQYQEMAEKTAMEQTAGSIRSALTMQMAALIARGRVQNASHLTQIDPMSLLADTQKNFVGEYFGPSPADIPPGSWYFDLRTRQLIYTVAHGRHFVPGADGNKLVRYKVMLVYNDAVPATGLSEDPREIGGVTLKLVAPYVWRID